MLCRKTWVHSLAPAHSWHPAEPFVFRLQSSNILTSYRKLNLKICYSCERWTTPCLPGPGSCVSTWSTHLKTRSWELCLTVVHALVCQILGAVSHSGPRTCLSVLGAVCQCGPCTCLQVLGAGCHSGPRTCLPGPGRCVWSGPCTCLPKLSAFNP